MFLIKQIGFAIAIIGMVVICIIVAGLQIEKVKNDTVNTFEVILFFTIVVCLVIIITL